MYKRIATLFAALLSLLAGSPSKAEAQEPETAGFQVRAGDVIVQRNAEGWMAVKILAVDRWPDGSSTAHCLTYAPAQTEPMLHSLLDSGVLVWHAPIAAASFAVGWELLGNQEPTSAELIGYTEYLKLTDYPRYLQLTGQDPEVVLGKANEHYLTANSLSEQGKQVEAIARYTAAIDLFPLFFEAIDNRAFTHMEQGDYRAALNDFEQSLRVNPDGVAAFFSRGECLMKLGELREAEAVFLEGKTRFPSDAPMFKDFLQRVRILQKGA